MTTMGGALIFMLFGAIFIAIQYFITRYLIAKGKNSLLMQFIGFLANFMFVFTLMWVQASFAEREFQAAGMSVVFFGGVTVIFAILFWRLSTLKKDYKALTWPSKKGIEAKR